MDKRFKKEGFTGQKAYVMPGKILRKAIAHPIGRSLYITDIGYYPQAWFHSRERTKGCAQHILIYCTKGAGWYKIGDATFRLSANQMVILPAKIPHQYGADEKDPWTIYWLHFGGEQSASLVKYVSRGEAHRPRNVSLNEGRAMVFQKMLSLLELADNTDNMIEAFLCLFYYLSTFNYSSASLARSPGKQDPVERSIGFMKQHLSGSVRLEDLAKEVSLSVSHYSTLFRQKTNTSPLQYFVFLKMQQACQLLKDTGLPVKQIAAELGYEDPFHFSRTFTRIIGVSPRGFRVR